MEKEKNVDLNKNVKGVINAGNAKAQMTDWSISSNGYCLEELNNEGAYLLTKSEGYFYIIVDIRGQKNLVPENYFCIGQRPGILFSQNEDVLKNLGYIQENVEETEYGFWPTNIASKQIQEYLISKKDNLHVIGTITSFSYKDADSNYEVIKNPCYEYKGKVYCLKEAEFCYNETRKLSDGEVHNSGELLCYEILPIKHIIDRERKIIIPKQIIIAGVMPKDAQTYLNDFYIKEMSQFNEWFYKKNQDIKNLKLLMEQYIELRDKRELLVSVDERDLLNCIGSLIEAFTSFDEISNQVTKNLLDIYNPIMEQYNNLFPINQDETDEENTTELSYKLSKSIDEQYPRQKIRDYVDSELQKSNIMLNSDREKLSSKIIELLKLIDEQIEIINDYYELGVQTSRKNMPAVIELGFFEKIKAYLKIKISVLFARLFGNSGGKRR